MSADRYRVLALERGLKVLQSFSPRHRALGASEIARRVGFPLPTVYRLLRTLQAAGFVEQLEDGRFTPAPAVLTLGFAALQSQDVVEAAREPLRKLALDTGETTNLGVRMADRVLYLDRHKTEHLMIANIVPGSTLPLARTSMGKLLLALSEHDEDLDALLPCQNESETIGPKAITTTAALREELDRIRSRGWAIQDEELAPNLRSAAVAVRSMDGVAGAINIAVDGQRVSTSELLTTLLPRLQRTASEISLRLGYLDAVH